MRVVSKAAIISRDVRPLDEKKMMTVEGAQVESVNADKLLCPFEGTNCNDFEVVSTR